MRRAPSSRSWSLNLSLQRGDEVIWPIQRAVKRYRNGGEDGIAAYVASVVGG